MGIGCSAIQEEEEGSALFWSRFLAIAILINTEDGSPPPVAMASEIAGAALGLPEKTAMRDLPVPKKELAALIGRYDSDEGTVELFERDDKLNFRISAGRREGVLLRQATNAYAINDNTDVHFVISDGGASWSMVYVGGLFLDAK